MDRLSDCILLSIFYRCDSACFLNRRVKNKNHRLRRQISVARTTHLNNYELLTDLTVVDFITFAELEDITILTNVLSLRLYYFECSEDFSKLGTLCPNLASLELTCDYSLMTKQLLSTLPKSLTSLRIGIPLLMGAVTSEELLSFLPLLTNCDMPTGTLNPSMKQSSYYTSTNYISSPSVESLTIYDSTRGIRGNNDITFNCPRLTSLDTNVLLTKRTLSSLPCATLTSLTLRTKEECDLTQLRSLRSLTMCADQVLEADRLPQSLTHLDIGRFQGELMVSKADSLPHLLTLDCYSVGPYLPKSLRDLTICGYYVERDLSRASLTSLTIHTALDECIKLPDTLTSLEALCDPIYDHDIAERLPERVRSLRTDHSTIPEEWSLSNIQRLWSSSPLSDKHKKEFRGKLHK